MNVCQQLFIGEHFYSGLTVKQYPAHGDHRLILHSAWEILVMVWWFASTSPIVSFGSLSIGFISPLSSSISIMSSSHLPNLWSSSPHVFRIAMYLSLNYWMSWKLSGYRLARLKCIIAHCALCSGTIDRHVHKCVHNFPDNLEQLNCIYVRACIIVLQLSLHKIHQMAKISAHCTVCTSFAPDYTQPWFGHFFRIQFQYMFLMISIIFRHQTFVGLD